MALPKLYELQALGPALPSNLTSSTPYTFATEFVSLLWRTPYTEKGDKTLALCIAYHVTINRSTFWIALLLDGLSMLGILTILPLGLTTAPALVSSQA